MFQVRVAPWFPGVVFGAMAILAALLTLLLPETHGRALPQSIEEIENWSRQHLEIIVEEPENEKSNTSEDRQNT